MPSRILPEVDHFESVQPTQEPIDFVQLQTVDLSQYASGIEAQRALAAQVREVVSSKGFFTLINHGIPIETITRQVDIGHTILKRTSLEEKQRLEAPILEKGSYPGFKLQGLWKVGADATDRIEQFNIYGDVTQNEQPAALKPFRPELQDLFGLALDLDDPNYFVKAHDYNGHDQSWLRYMEYESHHDSRDGVSKKTLWLNSHKDLTTLSLLFSQPMTTLQVRDEDGDANEGWKYVAHVPGAIIVNAGEIMSWFTGDYFKAAIHRVVEPPRDQIGRDRSSVFYFTVPNDDVLINTLLEQSPVLRAAGVQMAHLPENAPTSKEWCGGGLK
ncbi:Clavaminate synthase-like protein [Thozetella sp. PMI_491]|nr:Clavaminate synthase-like protein [Thozetella sp. PMI_491]